MDGDAEHHLSVIIPFRPFRLDQLGRDVVSIPIRDPLHVTILALIELLDTAAVNIDEFEGSIPNTAILARFYDAVVQDKLVHASIQEYRDQKRRVPRYATIQDAPVAIAGIAGATTLIEAFSLQAVAAYLHTLMEVEDVSTDSVRRDLREVASLFKSVAKVKNRELMEDHGQTHRFHVTPAIRLVPPDLPRLILIPADGKRAEVLPFPG